MTDVAEENQESVFPIDWALGGATSTSNGIFAFNPQKLQIFAQKSHRPTAQVVILAGTDPSDSKIRFPSVRLSTDGQGGKYGLVTWAQNQVYEPDTGIWRNFRGGNPNVAQLSTAAAGPTSIFTAAAGVKFRLIYLSVHVGGEATLSVAGTETVTITDSNTPTTWFAWSFQMQTTALATGINYLDKEISFPAGSYPVSGGLAKSLQVTLGTAMNAGTCDITAFWFKDS